MEPISSIQGCYDAESAAADTHLLNETVQELSWRGISVMVRDKATKNERKILDNVGGTVKAGMLAGEQCWLINHCPGLDGKAESESSDFLMPVQVNSWP